jgi:hypothetical protein
MSRDCIFAYTRPNDINSPPYINFTAVDGKVIVTLRGELRPAGSVVEHKNLIEKNADGDTVLRFDSPGHTETIELPYDQVAALVGMLTVELRTSGKLGKAEEAKAEG